jgi:hypothetical protein
MPTKEHVLNSVVPISRGRGKNDIWRVKRLAPSPLAFLLQAAVKSPATFSIIIVAHLENLFLLYRVPTRVFAYEARVSCDKTIMRMK